MNAQTIVWNWLGSRVVRARMLDVAMRCGAKTRAEAEDCVQDALVSAVRSATPVEQLDRADAWLAQIVVNATRIRLRANARRRRGGGTKTVEFLEEAHETLADASNPEHLVLTHESLAHLETALQQDRDGELLDACLTWDGTMRSLAETRGENVAALKTRLRRLRLRLRAALEAT